MLKIEVYISDGCCINVRTDSDECFEYNIIDYDLLQSGQCPSCVNKNIHYTHKECNECKFSWACSG